MVILATLNFGPLSLSFVGYL